MEQAKIPAFLAPLMAIVATGTPGGICTIDRRESIPFIEDNDMIGTTITCNGVNEATMPGICADKPDHAIITFMLITTAF